MNQTAGRRKHKRKNAKNVYNLAMREVAKRHISQVLSIERAERKDRTNLRR